MKDKTATMMSIIFMIIIVVLGIALWIVLASNVDVEVDCEIKELQTFWASGDISCPAIISSEKDANLCIVPKDIRCHAKANGIPAWMAK